MSEGGSRSTSRLHTNRSLESLPSKKEQRVASRKKSTSNLQNYPTRSKRRRRSVDTMDGASDSGSGAASEVEYSTATAFQMKRCITKATVPGMVKTLVRVKGDADKETRETFVLTLDYYITPIKCLRLLIKNYKQTPTLSKTSITFERDQKVARVRVINVLVTLLEYRYQTLKHITEWQDILDKFLEFLETDVHGAPFVKIITSKMNPSPPRKSNELDTPTDTKSKRSSARVPFNVRHRGENVGF